MLKIEKVKEETLQAARSATEAALKSSIEVTVASLTVMEVKKRLRSLGHPITLYGEDDEARCERLKGALAEFAAEEDEAEFSIKKVS